MTFQITAWIKMKHPPISYIFIFGAMCLGIGVLILKKNPKLLVYLSVMFALVANFLICIHYVKFVKWKYIRYNRKIFIYLEIAKNKQPERIYYKSTMYGLFTAVCSYLSLAAGLLRMGQRATVSSKV